MKLLEGNITKNAVLGVVYKFSGMAIIYLSVPVLINILGTEQYGLWVTLASVFGLVALMDLGSGPSLQNMLTTVCAQEDFRSSRELVSTTYILLSTISAVILAAGLLLILIFPATGIIDTLGLPERSVNSTLIIMLVSGCAGLILNLYIYICNSQKQTAKALLAGLVSQVFIFSGLIILSQHSPGSPLTAIALNQGLLTIIVLTAASILLFRARPYLKPGFIFYNSSLIAIIIRTGAPFFIIHLCWALINSTDNIIISSQLGSAEVTVFSLVYKLISIGKVVFFLLLTPFWPHFAELYNRQKIFDMKKLISRYTIILLIVNTLIVAVSFLIPGIIRIWTGRSFEISTMLIVFCSLFIMMDNVGGLFTYCLNATNRIKMQMYLYIIGGIINIPLSLLLVNTTLGSAGVVVASCICYLPLVIIMPLQVYLELKKVKENDD